MESKKKSSSSRLLIQRTDRWLPEEGVGEMGEVGQKVKILNTIQLKLEIRKPNIL